MKQPFVTSNTINYSKAWWLNYVSVLQYAKGDLLLIHSVNWLEKTDFNILISAYWLEIQQDWKKFQPERKFNGHETIYLCDSTTNKIIVESSYFYFLQYLFLFALNIKNICFVENFTVLLCVHSTMFVLFSALYLMASI